MIDEEVLFWYREGRFTADDVTRATGLSEASQRQLLKLGILEAVPQARRSAQRLLDSTMVKRCAVIAPLNRNGLTLTVAGKTVAAALMLEDFYFGVIDPWHAVFDPGGQIDPKTGLTPRRAPLRDRDRWIEPQAPKASDDFAYKISIVNSRYVIIGTFGVLGELAPDFSDFIWWDEAIYDHVKRRVKDGALELSVRGTDDHHSPHPFGTFDATTRPKTIPFKIKTPTADDKEAAEYAKENPVTELTVNAILSLKFALRRLLYIDVPLPRRKPMASQEFLDKYYGGGPQPNGGKSVQ